MGKQKSNIIVPTYFEILVDHTISRYTTTEYLPGRKEVYDFCVANGIPVKNEFQIITIILRAKSNIVLLAKK